MRWSKVKQLVEQSFADSVRGRVKLYSTHYHCDCGRGWITVDGEELADLSTWASVLRFDAYYNETTPTTYPYPKHAAISETARQPGRTVEKGEFSRFDLHQACWFYLHHSVNESLKSDSPLVVALALLSARVGKTRLEKLQARKLHPLPAALLKVRLRQETGTQVQN